MVQIFLSALVLAVLCIGLANSLHQSVPPIAQITDLPAAFSIDPNTLQAEAAVVYDPTDGHILFAKNDEEQLPLASLTKLMTADAALGVLSATSSVRVSEEAIQTEGDSGLKAGQIWKAGDLIKYALLVSSNDGMAAVAESAGGPAFMQKMNDDAETLGLAQSYFLDPTGLDLTTDVSGGYGSARDVALLASAFYETYPSFFESTLRSGSTFGSGANAVSGTATAAPLLDIPGLIGAKTGYTDLAGGNLVALFDIGLGHPVAAVVLHSTEEGRFSDMRALITEARAAAVH